MAPTDSSDVGLTIRELVLEIRADVKDLREDLVPRVQVLETDGIRTKAVATALLKQKKQGISTRVKVAGFIYATFNVIIGIMALGPDIIH